MVNYPLVNRTGSAFSSRWEDRRHPLIQGKGSIAIFFLNGEVVGEVLNLHQQKKSSLRAFNVAQQVQLKLGVVNTCRYSIYR